jgi:hypothetical protein
MQWFWTRENLIQNQPLMSDAWIKIEFHFRGIFNLKFQNGNIISLLATHSVSR